MLDSVGDTQGQALTIAAPEQEAWPHPTAVRVAKAIARAAADGVSAWVALTIDSDENDLECRLVQFHASHKMNKPCCGHHLHRMFTNRGKMDCHIDVQPVFVTNVALACQAIELVQS